MRRSSIRNTVAVVIIIAAAAAVIIGMRLGRPAADALRAESQTLPQRIVSLAPNITEILFALGLGEQVAAVSNDSDFPEQAKDKKKIGAFFRPNTEAVIACRPDLVIGLWFSEQRAVAESLKRLGYNVLTVELQRLDQLAPAIKEIGEATGTQATASELVKRIDKQLDEIQNRYASSARPKVLWVVQDEPVRVAGRRTFINELIALAGGENAIGPTLMQYPQVGSEQLLTSGAEVIIQSAMLKGQIAKEQQAAEVFWEKYSLLPAVKNKRIYVVDPDTTLRLGPRVGDGAELIAGLLHREK
jgi:iron complex transport system substrate-binding protein